MSEKLRATYIKGSDPTDFGNAFVVEREPTRFSFRGGRPVRDKGGSFVKHDSLLDLRGQLIQTKQQSFEVIKELSALRTTTADLLKKIAQLESENEHQRGRIKGLSEAITLMSEARK